MRRGVKLHFEIIEWIYAVVGNPKLGKNCGKDFEVPFIRNANMCI
jgi:hypothetical protein